MTTQNEPVEDGSSDATDTEKLNGIVEQTAQDISIGSIGRDEASEVLRQRLEDAGMSVGDDEFARLVERITTTS